MKVFKRKRVWTLYTVKVHYQLMLKVGVIILRVKLKILAKQRDVEPQGCSHVPCFFLLYIRIDKYVSATRQQRHILCQSMRRTIALANRCADGHNVERRIFYVQTWRDEAAIKTRMIPTQARHNGKLLSQLISVLRIQTKSGLLCHVALGCRQ